MFACKNSQTAISFFTLVDVTSAMATAECNASLKRQQSSQPGNTCYIQVTNEYDPRSGVASREILMPQCAFKMPMLNVSAIRIE
jgi:hypothetical protein